MRLSVMKFNSVIICVVLLLLNFIPITAQNEYAIASCDSSPTPRDYIGDKFYLVLPNNRDMLILSFPKNLNLDECRMQSEMVIVLFESIDFILCILQRKKPVNVQKFISEAPVKRFDKCVVRWFSRSGKI